MSEYLKPELEPFAKIKKEDLLQITPQLEKRKIAYSVKTIFPSDLSKGIVELLSVEAQSKSAVQKIVDHHFSKKKPKKSSFYISADKKFVLVAALFLFWILFKQFLKFGG